MAAPTTDHRSRYLVAGLLLMLHAYPVPVPAQWAVNPQAELATGQQAMVAYTRNEQGYTLEIFRDAGSVRSRFILNGGLAGFSDRYCPTYQIDQGTPNNLSVDGGPCVHGQQSAEYILGYIEGNNVVSPLLLALMNGNAITFRFQLKSGDFRETQISLAGSKRSMTTVIGETVTVRAR